VNIEQVALLIWYYDLWGRYHTPSLSGCHYFLCIVDDFSSATWVYLLVDKSEMNILWILVAWLKLNLGLMLKRYVVIMGQSLLKVNCKVISLNSECFVKPHTWTHPNKMVMFSRKINIF